MGYYCGLSGGAAAFFFLLARMMSTTAATTAAAAAAMAMMAPASGGMISGSRAMSSSVLAEAMWFTVFPPLYHLRARRIIYTAINKMSAAMMMANSAVTPIVIQSAQVPGQAARCEYGDIYNVFSFVLLPFADAAFFFAARR